MQNERNSFDDKIRERVEEYAFPFDQSGWDDMQRRLDTTMPVAWWKKWYNLLIALFLLTGAGSALYWLQSSQTEHIAIDNSTNTLDVYKPESGRKGNASMAALKENKTNKPTFSAEKINIINSSATIPNLDYLQTSEKGKNERPIILARKARTFKTYRHSVRNALTSASNGSTPLPAANGISVNGANRPQFLNTPFQAFVSTQTTNLLAQTAQMAIQSSYVEEGSAGAQFVSLNTSNTGRGRGNLNRGFNRNFLAAARYKQMGEYGLVEDGGDSNSDPDVTNVINTTPSANSASNDTESAQILNASQQQNYNSGSQYSTWFVASYGASESTNRNSSSAKTFNEQGGQIGIKASYLLSKKLSVEVGLFYAQNKYNTINQASTDTSFGMVTSFVKQKHIQLPIQLQYQILEHKNVSLSATAGATIRNSTTIQTLDYVKNITLYDLQGHLAYANAEQKTIVNRSAREWNTGVNVSLNGVWSLNERMQFVLSPYWQRIVSGSSNVRGRSMGVNTSINFKF
ncbi:hypothetical protein SAMN05421780_1086 [Flexibacter flexilis DSM 6793]|uniref:Uncharacterized protein n=1 Tax=Flexibacter flexilis DSM 6793 TaxID=927664 RepID=A0A1I1L0Q9_9BACT|nr:hypothetical protein [Flexibacter flexilis]SFC66656.1 hypothetical protein SAMN05421780_1086 [Flexibacter flexilis DSM 6793]